MAKLNNSKKNERALQASLDESARKCDRWQEKAEAADKLAKGAQALQNTIDHLENRLELANVEKLDAQEELFNVQSHKSPFDHQVPKLRLSTIVEDHTKVRRADGPGAAPAGRMNCLGYTNNHIYRLRAMRISV